MILIFKITILIFNITVFGWSDLWSSISHFLDDMILIFVITKSLWSCPSLTVHLSIHYVPIGLSSVACRNWSWLPFCKSCSADKWWFLQMNQISNALTYFLIKVIWCACQLFSLIICFVGVNSISKINGFLSFFCERQSPGCSFLFTIFWRH